MIKIKLEKYQKVWFTSDTHYAHPLMIMKRGWWELSKANRKFKTIEEMNKAIVNNINAVVGEDDILFHLGDWSFGGIDNIWEFRKQIKCKTIHLITGNHDHHQEKDKLIPNCSFNVEGEIVDIPNINLDTELGEIISVTTQQLFTSVSKYMEVELVRQMKKNEPAHRSRFVLFHYPIASWNYLGSGMRHLHGHIHTSNKNKIGKGRMMDVGIDGHPEFRPYSLFEINELLKNKKPKSMLTHGEDYHELNSKLWQVLSFVRNALPW